MDAVLVEHQAGANQPLPPQGVNKWEALRELSAARQTFRLTDRDLGVLQALVSFHPTTLLGGNERDLVVHPSNRAICERLNGMPESTMRRHLSHLVQAGVILRRDSPNGKRYVRRHGDERVAYGFDLSPLAYRFAEICAAAEDFRREADRFRRLRETVSLMRRDLVGLSDYGSTAQPETSQWGVFLELAAYTARELRRKLSIEDLSQIKARLLMALDVARDLLELGETKNLSASDVHNEQHYQNSKKDLHEYEPCLEEANGEGGAGSEGGPDGEGVGLDLGERRTPKLPLGLVLKACSEIRTYVDGHFRHWHELVRAADIVRPMMGISPSAWDEAREVMGPEDAATVLVAMLERFGEIKSPGGYLRHLTAKAELGEFSCGPMVMALLRKEAA